MAERRARTHFPSVPVVGRIDAATLERRWLARNEPVVLRLADSERWRSGWTPAAICARHADAIIEAEETREVYVGERALRPRRLDDAVQAMVRGDTALRWKGLEFLARVPAMRAELEASPAPYRALLPASARALRDTLWIAPADTTSSLHHDGDFDNLNLQISGQKLFVLAPPAFRRELYAYGSAESPINPFAPDLARFPRFARVPVVEALLRPGDVLFVPKYWWHGVYAVAASVNLSTHFGWAGEPRPWDVLAGVPLIHRSLTVTAAALKRRRLHRLADASRRAWYWGYSRLFARVAPQPRVTLAIEPDGERAATAVVSARR